MNFMPFGQAGACSCTYSNTPAFERDMDALTHDAAPRETAAHLDVQTLVCPACGRVRFLIVPVEAVELPLAS
jgi:hypothetical protein